jgi:hypothetical protein
MDEVLVDTSVWIWGDVQILASAVACGIPLWTTDKRLAGVASDMGILWAP